MKQKVVQRGFTLIELLVVVLVIGILSAIAVPQYQKAVLKSRFSSLVPTTKAITNGNEAYYLTHSRYADEVAALDITTTPKAETHLTLSDDSNYAYVLATREDIKNNLIMYQRHSANYPGEVHCEALTENEQANWLCETALKGTNIETVLNNDYTTYILQGSGNGLPPAVDDGNSMSCDKAISMGFTCTVNEDGTEKKICTTIGNTNICRTKTLNEDGGYTSITCKANEAQVCIADGHLTIYDEDGKRMSERTCSSVDSEGACTAYGGGYDYTYDENGNMTSQQWCSIISSTVQCKGHSNGYDRTYDENGNRTSSRYCYSHDSSGRCTYYSTMNNSNYTYDGNGNMTSMRQCSSVNSDGNCTAYGSVTYYEYDEEGKQISSQSCSGSNLNASTGECIDYSSPRVVNN